MAKNQKLFTYVGTKGQIAPEIEEIYVQLMKKQQGQYNGQISGYSGHHVDMFNAGIILFCMIFQRMPFERAINQDPVYKYVVLDNAPAFWNEHRKNGLPVDKISSDCKSLIYALLYRQPALRISIVDALSFQWFQT